MSVADVVTDLEAAAAVMGDVIAHIRDDQWELPTPCSQLNVQALVDHVISGNRRFADLLTDDPAEGGPQGSEPLELYDDSVRILVAAFRQPGALDRVVRLPIGEVPGVVAAHLRTVECLVHGWDVARATGQQVEWPQEVADREIVFSREALPRIPAGHRPFADPKPVADDAPAIDRLAALLGRTVD